MSGLNQSKDLDLHYIFRMNTRSLIIIGFARWMTKFKAVEDVGVGSIKIVHVKAHSGIEGNERADKLAGMGSRLRFDTMVRSKPRGWFRNMVEKYWSNRI